MKKGNVEKGILLFGILLAVTGCGKSKVGYDVDVPETANNSQSPDLSDSGSLAARLGIPEGYTGAIDVGNSSLSKISIDDTNIQVPDTDSMNVVYLSASSYSNEYKKNVCESILDKSQGIYAWEYGIQSKEDIQTQIDLYERYKENDIANGGTGTGYDAYLNYLNEEILEAPASVEYQTAGDYSGNCYMGYIGNTRYEIDFSENADGGVSGFSICMLDIMNGNIMDYKPYDYAVAADMTSAKNIENMEENIENQCSLSEDDAVRMANGYLADAGISGYTLTDIDDVIWLYYDIDGDNFKSIEDGYTMEYSMAIDNVPVYNGQIWNVENIQQEGYAISYQTEIYSVTVDGNGLLSMECTVDMSAVETEENVNLLTWEQLLEQANQNISEYYEEYPSSYGSISFNNIRLTYFLDVASYDKAQYEYVPAWVFAKCEESEDNNPVELVVLDARDGHVIDISEAANMLGKLNKIIYDDETEQE
jgi:hypothetical protein